MAVLGILLVLVEDEAASTGWAGQCVCLTLQDLVTGPLQEAEQQDWQEEQHLTGCEGATQLSPLRGLASH